MYLIIDQGNTHTKMAIAGNGDVLQTWIFNPSASNLVSEMIKKYQIKKGIWSNVSDGKNNDMILTLTKELEVLPFNHETPIPLKNKYETPHTLGYDRLAGAIGAWTLFPEQNSLVIDAGTCINYEFVKASGEYMGGAISPGMQMRFRSLHDYTGKLPLIDQSFHHHSLLGKDTINSILSGVMNGILMEIDGIIQQYEHIHGKINVILTGGDADYFGKYLKNKTFAQPNLILIGLYETLRQIDEN